MDTSKGTVGVWMQGVGRLWNRARRAYRKHPGWRCVVEHPVAEDCWNRCRGINGWVAGVRSIAAVTLYDEQGHAFAAQLVPRPDVAYFLRYQFACQAGFVCSRPVDEWLGASHKATVLLLIRFDDGTTAEQSFTLVDPVESRCAKRARYRHLLRDPETGAELVDTTDGLRSAEGARVFPVAHGVADFLPDTFKQQFGIEDTENVSSWGYDAVIVEEVTNHPERLYLDCGAGLRTVRYPNVVHYEIVPYSSTDVLGVAEKLPFADGSFDGIISIAVLEHVKDPFLSAAELQRVLAPGGRMFCAVPFLQPRHGYPHHYYNMTAQGMVNLFPSLCVESVSVPPLLHPMVALQWMLYAYSQGLPEGAQRRFAALRVKDVLAVTEGDSLWQVDAETQSTLAGGHLLVAHKPDVPDTQ